MVAIRVVYTKIRNIITSGFPINFKCLDITNIEWFILILVIAKFIKNYAYIDTISPWILQNSANIKRE